MNTEMLSEISLNRIARGKGETGRENPYWTDSTCLLRMRAIGPGHTMPCIPTSHYMDDMSIRFTQRLAL